MDNSSNIFPLELASQRFSDATAISYLEQSVSYQEYFEQVLLASRKLMDSGVKKGDRVAILSENSIEFVYTFFALMNIGAVAAPLSTYVREGEINNIIKSINAAYLIVSESEIQKSSKTVNTIPFARIFDENESESADHSNYAPGNEATIFFTSGSSGNAKAVLHNTFNHLTSAHNSNKRIPFSKNDTWLVTLPFFHVGGIAILFRAMLSGGTVHIKSEAEDIAVLLMRKIFSHISLVPTQLHRLIKAGVKLQKFKVILLGGAPIPEALIGDIRSLSLPVYITYGLTEFASQVATSHITYTRLNEPLRAHPLDHCQIKVDASGEILLKGESQCLGYIENKKVTRPFDHKNWFQTGDIGNINADGKLHIRGRKDNMFISGGENIHPEIVENKIFTYDPGIIEAIVVPIKDEEYGFRPVAFVRTSEAAIDVQALKAYLKSYLPGIMVPVEILRWPANMIETGMKTKREDLIKVAEKIRGVS